MMAPFLPMLAVQGQPFDSAEFLFEVKWNGVRALAASNAVSEMLAIAWSWFVRLAQRGKDAALFPSVLATYAARAVRSGRRLCGQEKAKDVKPGAFPMCSAECANIIRKSS